jgi:mismatch-specific thymine-DNA glycosylase
MLPEEPSTRAETVENPSPSECQASNTEPITPEPPTPSFKGQLSKFQYASTTSASEDVNPKSTVTPRSSKRTRKTVTIATTADETSNASSPRPNKKRKSSNYASSSKYAHLSPLVDILEPNLICVFVGTNPGVQTATAGHAYAHPSNHFWKLLHSSGLTDRRLAPSEDRSLPAKYCMGNTNIVSRPSKNAAELSKEEMVAGAGDLEAKFREFRPEAVCIVGKGIWEAIWKYKMGKAIRRNDFRYGWQDEEMNMGKVDGEEGWPGSRVFVTTSTSGLAANLKPAEKEAIWRPFGEWVEKRREESGFVPRDDEGTVQQQ